MSEPGDGARLSDRQVDLIAHRLAERLAGGEPQPASEAAAPIPEAPGEGIFTTVDDRFRASVLLAGGLFAEFPPEVNVINFAPRSRVPTLMLNGRDDFMVPFEFAQEPFLTGASCIGSILRCASIGIADRGRRPRRFRRQRPGQGLGGPPAARPGVRR